jgi:hypothetical protein
MYGTPELRPSPAGIKSGLPPVDCEAQRTESKATRLNWHLPTASLPQGAIRMQRLDRVRTTTALFLLAGLTIAWSAVAQNAAVTVDVDASAGRRPISPAIYGVAYADAATLADLNCPINRRGGNNRSRYNVFSRTGVQRVDRIGVLQRCLRSHPLTTMCASAVPES